MSVTIPYPASKNDCSRVMCYFVQACLLAACCTCTGIRYCSTGAQLSTSPTNRGSALGSNERSWTNNSSIHDPSMVSASAAQHPAAMPAVGKLSLITNRGAQHCIIACQRHPHSHLASRHWRVWFVQASRTPYRCAVHQSICSHACEQPIPAHTHVCSNQNHASLWSCCHL
jgi:hypothetical protein